MQVVGFGQQHKTMEPACLIPTGQAGSGCVNVAFLSAQSWFLLGINMMFLITWLESVHDPSLIYVAYLFVG